MTTIRAQLLDLAAELCVDADTFRHEDPVLAEFSWRQAREILAEHTKIKLPLEIPRSRSLVPVPGPTEADLEDDDIMAGMERVLQAFRNVTLPMDLEQIAERSALREARKPHPIVRAATWLWDFLRRHF